MGNSLFSVRYVSVWEKVWSVYGMCFHLRYVGLVSLLDGLLGFKGFIGKVDNPPFLLWGVLV